MAMFLGRLSGGPGRAGALGDAARLLCVRAWYGVQRFAWEFLKPYPRLSGRLTCSTCSARGWLSMACRLDPLATAAAHARRARRAPYLFHGQTTSLCETCLRLVPAKVIGEERMRLLSQALPRPRRAEDADQPTTSPTGSRSATGSSPATGRWPPRPAPSTAAHRLRPLPRPRAALAASRSSRSTRPATSPARSVSPNRRSKRGGHRPLAEIEAMLDALVASRGRAGPGADLRRRADHPSAVLRDPRRRRKARPIRHLMINTNGVRIAREPGFAERLADYMPRLRGLPAVRLAATRGADGPARRRPVPRSASEALEALERGRHLDHAGGRP